MKTVLDAGEIATIEATNVGGIDRTTVSFAPGVTLLTGRNATNRTSLLQAITAALGSERATLKGDADAGEVTLSIGERTYTRTLTRTGRSVRFDGDPYLDSTTAADLFAFLLGDNEARRVVLSGEDLREVIMRPVDTEAIREEISELQTEQREVEGELERLEQQSDRLVERREERERLEARLSEKSDELEAKRAELEAADRDVDSSRERESEADEKMDELRETRSSLERVRDRLGTNESSIEALEAELADHEDELATLDDAPAGELSAVEARIGDLRDRKSSLDSTINRLREVVRFNEEMLDGGTQLFDSLGDRSAGDASAESLTSELVDGATRTCWTCGNEVAGDEIEATVERLRSLIEERLEERSEVESTLAELTERKRTFESRREERERLERKLERVRREIDDRRETVADLREERSELESAVATIEAEVEALEGDEYDELLELHREVNRLEFETDRIRDDVDELTGEIESMEAALATREELAARAETIAAELEERRTRIERLETDAVEAFNEHMDTVLAVLGYENIDRIWLERVEREVREGRRKVERGFFDLHVVRSTDEGVSYEDTVDHLSESEQDVTGLIFALAGYLVHELYDSCPFMLLDSLEAIDSNRIVDLVEYFAEHSAYLVVALLPEDAAAFDDEVARVTSI